MGDKNGNEKGNLTTQILAGIAFIVFLIFYYLTRLGYL